MGYRHSRDDILEAAASVALDGGMAALTFAKVGERLGISDRTVVYYFPTKPDLVVAVAEVLGADLQRLLADAFGTEPRTQRELIRDAWPVLTTASADRVFALFFEILGLASAGQAPYDALARVVVDAWIDWLAMRMVGSSPDVRRRRALAAVAQIDGLLLLRRIVGAEASDAAAKEAMRST